jgi:flavodoxin/ferredoxin
MPTIAKVWIEEDCITCDACEDILPEVFAVIDDSSLIKSDVREDGVLDRNTGFSAIKAEFRIEYSELIEEAADACPVEIIKFEYEGGAVEAEAQEAAPTVEAVAAPVAIASVAGADEGVLSSVLSGDRGLAVFFGSQTGNAAGLAEKTVKRAAAYGLEGSVIDMDGYDQAKFATHKRILIITSTWGEGEMPDNADILWNATCSTNPALAGVHYSVCAIGDSSYDEYCKAGHDWDQKFSSLGATSVLEIKLCDVDFDEPGSSGFQKFFLDSLV